MIKLPTVIVNEKALRRLKSGYPWVARHDLAQPGLMDFEPGILADFIGPDGLFAARGYLHPHTQIAGRMVTRYDHEAINRDFWSARLDAALKKRADLYQKPFYRLVHAESDGFPGLIVDRYGDVLVAQVNTAGMEKLYPEIERIIVDKLQPKAIVLRNDTPSREKEGLEPCKKVSYGRLQENVVRIEENDVLFDADIMEGQKTGWFFDQRGNRRDVAGLAEGKTMLDVFCHTGGFGVTAAAKGALAVTFVDSSAAALEKAQKNAALNGVTARCHFIEGKAFDVLPRLEKEGKSFDLVCVDPPAFIKSREEMASGLRGYQKLARLAAPLVAPEGWLFFASCSHHAGLKDLIKNVAEGIRKAGRTAGLVKTSGAEPDHPVHPMLPETGYLKALTFRFSDGQ